jgi:hypothetical protein
MTHRHQRNFMTSWLAFKDGKCCVDSIDTRVLAFKQAYSAKSSRTCVEVNRISTRTAVSVNFGFRNKLED